MINKRWTDEEIETLRKHYPNNVSMDRILHMLPERSYTAVVHKASRLGLVKGNYIPVQRRSRRWTENEINFVRAFYGRVDDREIVDTIPHRTVSSVKSLIFRVGGQKKRTHNPRNPSWTPFETKLLAKNYTKMTNDELMEILPNRSFDAIRARLYVLGLRRCRKSLAKAQACKIWTDEEIEILKNNMKLTARETQELLPHRSLDAIQGQKRRIRQLYEVFQEG
jgi:hypothetical protein